MQNPPVTHAFDYDFAIIGSGFGGSVAALRLSEKGYRVLVLEQGKRYRPNEFAKTSWNVRKYLWQPSLGWYGIMKMTLLSDLFVLHGVGVGGGSLVYANTLLVPPDEVFRGPGWVGQDWQAALVPHYATAKRMLGVVEAPRVYYADEVLREVARDLGADHTFHRTQVGVFFGTPGVTVPDPYFGGQGPDRTGCTHCGACMVGCRVGAKNTLDRNYLYFAEQHGAAVWAEQRVTAVVPRHEGGYDLEMRRSTGMRHPRRRVSAEQVVFAAGVLGTVELLLRMKQRAILPHLSDQLGNFVRTNSETLVGARSNRKDADCSTGIAIAAGVYIDDKTHIEVCRYNEGSDALAPLATVLTGGGPPWPRWLRWMGNLVKHPGQALGVFFPFGWAKRSAILLVMQPIESFLRLVLRRRGLWPFAYKLDTSTATSKPVPSYLPIANEVAKRMAEKMDGIAYSGLIEVTRGKSSTAHILGGCPIGESKKDGVIDVRCRVFGHEGLYVLDGSAVPGNLGVNPSLTITAIAEHAMSFVPDKLDRTRAA
jgi:cholesterol oxidase